MRAAAAATRVAVVGRVVAVPDDDDVARGGRSDLSLMVAIVVVVVVVGRADFPSPVIVIDNVILAAAPGAMSRNDGGAAQSRLGRGHRG